MINPYFFGQQGDDLDDGDYRSVEDYGHEADGHQVWFEVFGTVSKLTDQNTFFQPIY